MRLTAIASGLVAAGVFVAAAVLSESIAVKIFTVGVFTAFLSGCALAIHLVRKIIDRTRRLERTTIANHKRASVWNHRLLTLMRDVGSPDTAKHEVAGAPNAAGTTRNWKAHPGAPDLIASGVFDHEYYAAAVKGRFARPLDAAAHYLSLGVSGGRMPTPLISRTALPAGVAGALQSGDAAPMLRFLRSHEAFERPLSSIFDARFSGVSESEARIHAGGVIGAFLERVTSASHLAVAPDSPLAGANQLIVLADIVGHLRDFHETAPSKAPREVTAWDSDAEVEYVKLLRQFDLLSEPLVTVVMPVKDRAELVRHAIASVQHQTYVNWELVVVDDGSTDETREVVSGISAIDPRVRLIINPGSGVSAARNTALRAAAGKYVAFLDSDNTWLGHFLDTSVRAMESESLDVAYAGVAIHEEDGGVRYRAFDAGVEQLRLLNHIDLNVLIVRRRLIEDGARFDESLKRWVDHDFVLKLAEQARPKLLPFIGCDYQHSSEASDRITVRESEHWQWVALERYWVRWDEASAEVEGRVSIVIPTYNDSAMTIAAATSVLRDAAHSGTDVEIVIIDNGSRIEVGQAILADIGAAPNVRYFRIPRNLNFAIGCNLGAVKASGEFVLFLNNDTLVRRGALTKLLEGLTEPGVIGVQPLLLYGDETIQTAGTVFSAPNSLPSHFLTGHPPADALSVEGVDFDVITAAAMLLRTSDLRMLKGFDSIFVNGMEDVDLCLRARERLRGAFRVIPQAVVTHLESKTPGRGKKVDENRRLFLERWSGRLPSPQAEIYRAAGFAVAHVGSDGRDVPGPRPVVIRDRSDSRRRWGIKIASIPGAVGDEWGDSYFAESLRQALEAQGARAVVHRHGAHQTDAAGFDDVVLVVRGLDRVRPMPGKVNILWVISHPDKVSIEEIREFDAVFAASSPWAHRATRESGRSVVPLLQSTDIARFRPSVEPVPVGKPIFVGKVFPARPRPIVDDALAAGSDIAVYGPGWGGLLPEGMHRGDHIPNELLASYYRGATRVLADHWGTMASEGFIQNRIFDAVASGARVVSDYVEDLERTFGGAARTYSSPSELAFLLGPASDDVFPSDEEMVSIADRIRADHSMARRAEELIAAVDDLLDQRR
ncbi:glycosyltransferase [Agrococcus sediminis]|uniref:glycosyltransferase n=1 Tax=Agrococcus sediminis TaxID=2599924 RepID=UPI003441670F